ncbi:MAG: endonuclease/exonuclease/phosphatase family protein [Candidatus Kariarchaeaceae archaeon]|jgi:endonuclease/exonuclease/phosphatase family metal-dependent hydrolase
MNTEVKRFSGILLVLLLVTIISIVSYQFIGEPDDNNDVVTSVRVMTYNIHLTYDFGAQGNINLVELKELIEENDPDIIGLQESEGNRLVSSNQNAVMWLAHKLKMHYYYGAPTSEGIWGVALLSRWKIQDPVVEYLPSEDALQRIAVVANIAVPDPFGTVNVIVTHLDFQDNVTQMAQVSRILDLTVPMDRAIIMGDFNTVIAQDKGKSVTEDPSYQLLNTVFTDAWVVSGGTLDEVTSYYFDETDDYNVTNSRIDYIFLVGGLSVEPGSHLVLGSKSISDHRAIQVEIKAE